MKIQLEKVLEYEQPQKYIVATENYSDEYTTPVLTAGKSFILGYTDEKDGIYKGSESPVIIFDDFTSDTKYVNFDFKVKSSAMKILHKVNEEDSLKYFFYAMQKIQYKPFSHKRLWISEYSKFEIKKRTPEEQKFVVNDLDNINNAILLAKERLLALDELVKSRFIEMFEYVDFPIKTIADVCTLRSGTTFDKSLELEKGEMLYCKVSDMNLVGNSKYMTVSKTYVTANVGRKSAIPANSVIFPKRGGAIGTNKKRITLNDTCVDLNTMGVTPNLEVDIQYLYQYFQNIDLGSLCDGSTIPQLNNKNIGPLKIKIPPISLQNEFAKFVKLIDKSKFVCQFIQGIFYAKFARFRRPP